MGLLLVAACTGRQPAVHRSATPAPVVAVDAEADRAVRTIRPTDLYTRIAYLASDALKGRDTPSPGLEAAALYIAGEFEELGLTPAGDNRTWIQRWPLSVTGYDMSKTAIRVEAGDWATGLRIGVDAFVVPAVGMPSASSPLVWGGRAAKVKKRLGSESASRFALLYVPGSPRDHEWHTAIEEAEVAALRAGVTGLVLVLDPSFDETTMVEAGESIGTAAPLFIIGLRYDIASAMVARTGLDLDTLVAAEARAPIPLDGARLTISVGRRTEITHPPNVVGYIEGGDPDLRDEYIVVSAHFDHIGTGAVEAGNDSIYNGADDNASGTAVMLEVAQAFASMSTPPPRSIIFLAVSGEEKGLLGSVYFTDYPPVPKSMLVANVNLDMVGRNAADSLIAVGQEYTSIGLLAHAVARARPELRLTIAPDPWPEDQLFFRSDHFNFARIGVPAIFFTTGMHADYHRQTDEVNGIDMDKVTRVGRFVFHLVNEIANAPGAPAWTERGIADLKAMGGRWFPPDD